MSLLEDYSSDDDVFNPHAQAAWQKSADHEQRAMADRAKRRGGRSFVNSHGQAMLGGVVFAGMVAVATLAHKHFVKGEPIFRRKIQAVGDALSDEADSTDEDEDEDEDIATQSELPLTAEDVPLHPRAEKMWGQPRRDESAPNPEKPESPADPTASTSPSKPSLPAVPAALKSPTKIPTQELSASAPASKLADDQPLASDTSVGQNLLTSESCSVPDATPKEAGPEAASAAKAAVEGHSTEDTAVPGQAIQDEPDAPSGAKPADKTSEICNTPAAKEPAPQLGADAAGPISSAEQSEPQVLEDIAASNVEEQTEKPGAAKDSVHGAQAAKDGDGLGTEKGTGPKAGGVTGDADEAIDGEPKLEGVSVPGFKLAKGADPAVGGSRRSADAHEAARKAEIRSEAPSSENQAGSQHKVERSTEEHEPGGGMLSAASSAVERVLEPDTQTLATPEESAAAKSARKEAPLAGKPVELEEQQAGKSDMGHREQDCEDLAAEQPAAQSKGSGDSGRSSFEAAAQKPLSEPDEAPPSANHHQAEAVAEEAHTDPKANPATEEKGMDAGAQADPDTDIKSGHQQSTSEGEEGSEPSHASKDEGHETGSSDGIEQRSGSLKSRSSSLKGHSSGGQKLERKVSFADGSAPGQASDDPPTKQEGGAEKALSHEIPEEQSQAASLAKEPASAHDSAGAAEPTTIVADADAINVEAGGPVHVSSVPGGKPSVTNSKSASGEESKSKECAMKSGKEEPKSPPKEAIPAAVASQFGVPVAPAVDTFFTETDVLTDIAEEAASGADLTKPPGEDKPAKKSEASSTAPTEQPTKKEEGNAAEAPKPAASEETGEAGESTELADDSKPVQAGKIPKDEVAMKTEPSSTDAHVGKSTPAAEEGVSPDLAKEESSAPPSPSRSHTSTTSSPRKAGALASESEASQSESEANGDHASRTAGGKTAAKKKAGGSGASGTSKKKKKRNK